MSQNIATISLCGGPPPSQARARDVEVVCSADLSGLSSGNSVPNKAERLISWHHWVAAVALFSSDAHWVGLVIAVNVVGIIKIPAFDCSWNCSVVLLALERRCPGLSTFNLANHIHSICSLDVLGRHPIFGHSFRSRTPHTNIGWRPRKFINKVNYPSHFTWVTLMFHFLPEVPAAPRVNVRLASRLLSLKQCCHKLFEHFSKAEYFRYSVNSVYFDYSWQHCPEGVSLNIEMLAGAYSTKSGRVVDIRCTAVVTLVDGLID